MPGQWEAMDEDAFRNLAAAGGQLGADDRGDQGEEEAGWDGISQALDAGQIVQVPATSDREIRRARNRLEKRAERRGFAIEVRIGDGFVAARKTGEAPDGEGRRHRRRDGERDERSGREQTGEPASSDAGKQDGGLPGSASS